MKKLVIKGIKPVIGNARKILKPIGNTASEAFGQVKDVGFKTNTIAACITFAPNVPAYFMPAFNQASATGGAKELREKEGYRGILTGLIEGASYGMVTNAVLASNETTKRTVNNKLVKRTINFKRLGCFSLFFGTIDYVYSILLSKLGEKLGKAVYKSKHKSNSSKIQKHTNTDIKSLKEIKTKILFKKA